MEKEALDAMTTWSLVANRLGIPKDIKHIVQNFLDPFRDDDEDPWSWAYDSLGVLLKIPKYPPQPSNQVESNQVESTNDWYPEGWIPLAPPPPPTELPYVLLKLVDDM